mgnify:FL=1
MPTPTIMAESFVIKGSVPGDEDYRDCLADMERCMANEGEKFNDFTWKVAARLFALASTFPELTGHQLRQIATERWCFSKTEPATSWNHDVIVHPYPRYGTPFWDEYQMKLKRMKGGE